MANRDIFSIVAFILLTAIFNDAAVYRENRKSLNREEHPVISPVKTAMSAPRSHITVCISSHNRHEKLYDTVYSIRRFYPTIPIVIVDDGELFWENSTLFPHVNYIKVGYDTGLPAVRNIMVENVKTTYTFIMDEDVLFTDTSSLEKMVKLLDTLDVDMVAGKLSGTWAYYARITPVNNTYYVCEKINPVKVGRCQLSHRCINLFVAHTSFLLENKWKEDRKLCEHSLYFGALQEKHPGRKVASCSQFKFIHNNRGNSLRYKKDRKRCDGKDSDRIEENCKMFGETDLPNRY